MGKGRADARDWETCQWERKSRKLALTGDRQQRGITDKDIATNHIEASFRVNALKS